MLISLNIQDQAKAKVFLEFLKNLDFVSFKTEKDDDEIQNMVNERYEEYKKNPSATVSLEDTLQSLKTKYGF